MEQYFPIRAARDDEGNAGSGDGGPQAPTKTPPPPPLVPELQRIKESLHEAIEALPLPANFLDVLIDELGGPDQVR